MKRIPSCILGLFMAPGLICIFFLLKAICSAGNSCVVDRFALPIFLPLAMVYKVFGSSKVIGGQDFIFILLYWSLIGFLLGSILDLYTRRSQYSPLRRPPL